MEPHASGLPKLVKCHTTDSASSSFGGWRGSPLRRWADFADMDWDSFLSQGSSLRLGVQSLQGLPRASIILLGFWSSRLQDLSLCFSLAAPASHTARGPRQAAGIKHLSCKDEKREGVLINRNLMSVGHLFTNMQDICRGHEKAFYSDSSSKACMYGLLWSARACWRTT